jgi:hypothetical protein
VRRILIVAAVWGAASVAVAAAFAVVMFDRDPRRAEQDEARARMSE